MIELDIDWLLVVAFAVMAVGFARVSLRKARTDEEWRPMFGFAAACALFFIGSIVDPAYVVAGVAGSIVAAIAVGLVVARVVQRRFPA